MDLVSVVVITYNSQDTVIETLKSVFGQTYERLELVVSDDCSKDNTLRIVSKWVKLHKDRFENVRIVVGKKNHGVVKNCNIGINQAKGQYVQVLSGDDILHKDAISKKYKYAEDNGKDIVFSKVEVFGENKRLVQRMEKFCQKGYCISKRGWEAQNKNIAIDNFVAGPSGSFYKKKYFMDFGGYDIRFPMVEDYPFYYKYIKNGNEIIFMDDMLIKYRVSGTSLCTSTNSAKFDRSMAKFFFLERFIELIKRREYKVAREQFLIFIKRLF
ncbi:MAG: glycosyltransferase family 2 protein [Lachnospiraceae bacterium]|nr:glycosyltransferase family 2 protein [Lachnospiraceae bacterium]